MMDHPLDEILIDYLLDELTEVETRAIKEHVESCDQCSTRIRKLMRVMNTLDELPNVETDGRIAERVLLQLKLSDKPLIKVLPPDELKRVVHRRRPILAGFAAAAVILFSFYLTQIYSPPGVFADKGVLNARLEVPSKVTPNSAVPVSLSIWDEAKEIKKSKEGNYDVEFKLASQDQTTLVDKASVSMDETSRRFINLSGIKPGEYQLQAWSDGKQLVSTKLEINPSYEISVTPDRPIYKPSDSINIRVSAREIGGKAASGKDVALVLRDPMDGLVKQESKKLDDFGTVGFEYPIADIAPLGEYLVVVRVDNSETEQKIIVDDYTMPRFSVDLQPERDFITASGTYKATVKANYFFGKPMIGSDVLVEWYVTESGNLKKIGSFNDSTDDSGEFKFAMNLVRLYPEIKKLKNTSETSYVRIVVSDKSGQQEELVKAVEMSAGSLIIRAYPENGRINPGLSNKIYVITTYPDGAPAVADLQIKVNDKTVSGNTSSLGIFTLNYQAETQDVFLKITAVSDGYASTSTEIAFEKSKIDFPFILRPMKSVFKSDEKIQLEMIVPFSVPMTAHLDLFKSDQWIASKEVEIKDSVTSVEWLSGGVTGELVVEGSLNFENRVFARDKTNFIISESDKLKVDIKTDSATYKPGEMVKAKVDVSANKQPAQASLGVTAADKSLARAGEKAEMSFRMISNMINAGMEKEFGRKFDLASNDEINEFGLAAASSIRPDDINKSNNSIGYRIRPEESSLRSFEFSVASNYPLVILRFILVGIMYLSIIFALISALANVHRGTFGKLPLGQKSLGSLKGFAVLTAMASMCFALSIYYPSIVILGLGLLLTIGVVLRLSKCIGSDELIADNFSLINIISATSILICSLLISHQGIWQPILRSLGQMHPFMNVSLLSILASIGCLVILTTMVIPDRGGDKNAKSN
jgi:hypothetical protein